MLDLYHKYDGIPGYRQISDYLALNGIKCSYPTTHKYMHEMGLFSITRHKYIYKKPGEESTIYPNLINRHFYSDKKNKIWLIDFTYIFTKDHETIYNCSIIDVYDRSVVATLNSTRIDTSLAINTLKLALNQNKIENYIILHSDQGSQFSSREFGIFCKEHNIQQSMSKAGCPYDNAPMERFYNTMKTEFVYTHIFKNREDVNTKIYNYVIHYNNERPHTYNNGMTPMMKRQMQILN